ncbi:MAG: DUF401 family protein [Fervidicoccaceae archaeon]
MSEAASLVFFAASVALAAALALRGLNVALSLAAAALLYGLAVSPSEIPRALIDVAVDARCPKTVAALVLALFLANLMSASGASRRLVLALSSAGPRVASYAVPAVVGLLPMPGGAYVSAVLASSIYDALGLNAEMRSFVNYWFRHLWVSVWPLYQTVLLAAGFLHASVGEIAAATWPVPVSLALAGLVSTRDLLARRAEAERRRELSGLTHAWPLFSLFVLAIGAGVDLALSLVLVSFATTLIYRVSPRAVAEAAKRAADPTLIGVVLASFFFGELVERGGATELVTELAGVNGLLACALAPFVVGLALGLEFTFVALTFPLLLPLISGGELRLLAAMAGGCLGSLLSPFHACLVMTVKHNNASLAGVYRRLLPAAGLSAALIALIAVVAEVAG